MDISIMELKKNIKPGLIKYMEKKAPGKSYSTYNTYASDSNYLINNNREADYIKFVRSDKDMPEIKNLIESILKEKRGEVGLNYNVEYYYEKLCWHREYIHSLGGIDFLLGIKSSKKKEKDVFTPWHVGVAAEALAAAQFARCGIAVSVQYGADQPEYDLVAVDGDRMLKVSVKGSKDGGWGLTQSYKKNRDYHEAIDAWLSAHGQKTIFCLVQFFECEFGEMPRLYLASPVEIADEMKKSRSGNGDTVLREYHCWGNKALAAGTEDVIPESWKFTKERVKYMFDTYA